MDVSREAIYHGYTLVLTCRHCGAWVRPVADGKPMELGREIRVTCECTECNGEFVLAVTMISTVQQRTPNPTPKPHYQTRRSQMKAVEAMFARAKEA